MYDVNKIRIKFFFLKKKRKLDLAAILLEPDVNARTNLGDTSLHLAARYGELEVFTILLHYGAELTLKMWLQIPPYTQLHAMATMILSV